MESYIVIYTEPESIDWLFFRCDADDGDHAEEQCVNAYPGCGIVGVYLGRFASDALRGMQREMGWDKLPEFLPFEKTNPAA